MKNLVIVALLLITVVLGGVLYVRSGTIRHQREEILRWQQVAAPIIGYREHSRVRRPEMLRPRDLGRALNPCTTYWWHEKQGLRPRLQPGCDEHGDPQGPLTVEFSR